MVWVMSIVVMPCGLVILEETDVCPILGEVGAVAHIVSHLVALVAFDGFEKSAVVARNWFS